MHMKATTLTREKILDSPILSGTSLFSVRVLIIDCNYIVGCVVYEIYI